MLYGRALHAATHEALSRLLDTGRLDEGEDEAAVLAAFERVGCFWFGAWFGGIGW